MSNIPARAEYTAETREIAGAPAFVATTRGPASFASAAATIGATIIPKTLAEAVKADIVFPAVRFESHEDVAQTLTDWQG